LIFTGQWKNFCKHISEVMESCDSERQEYYAGEMSIMMDSPILVIPKN
jgi:hypothetical protein